MRVLFVCLGNICRSPTAEAVLRHRARERGLQDVVEIDSAGTGDWHVGAPPDRRAAAAAARREVAVDGAGRQVTAADLRAYDLVLAMDRRNQADLLALAGDDEDARGRIRLLRAFDPASADRGDLDVPDPYFGADGGFDEVLDLVEAACDGLLDELAARAR